MLCIDQDYRIARRRMDDALDHLAKVSTDPASTREAREQASVEYRMALDRVLKMLPPSVRPGH
ncbi:MAG: hypothetical protein PVF68_11395 [Acidobacteriota bacterium]|jgi:hypothetical protein